MILRKSADQRTADLLAAAERILDRRDRLTVSELATEAGIASGTFYLYFPSKAHLEATLIERFIDTYVEAGLEAIQRRGSLLERLTATLDAMVDTSVEHQSILRLQVNHSPTIDTRGIIGQRVDDMKHVIADALQAGIDDGETALTDPEMTAALLFHGIEGVIRDAITQGRDLEPERLRQALHQQLTRLVGQPV